MQLSTGYLKLMSTADVLFPLVVFSFAVAALLSVFCRRWIKQPLDAEIRFPVPPDAAHTWRWHPIVGHIPSLGIRPHRTLAELDRRLGYVGALFMRLGSRRAVVINGSKAVRSAAARHGRGQGHATPSPLDDRPDFEVYRWYADGRSVSFAAAGPRLRAQRRVAAAAIARLIGGDCIAEKIVRREADQLVMKWLRGADEATTTMTTASREDSGFDPADDIVNAVGSALFSMCYGADEKLAENVEYSRLLLGDNPGTELFAIGKQPDLFPRWVRRFVVDDSKQQDHFQRMSTHVRLNEDKIRECHGGHVISTSAADEDRCDKAAIRGCCVADSVTDEWRRRADKLQSAGLTHKHLTGLPVEFLSAGSETSSATLLWLLLLMALHEDVQGRVHAELDSQLTPDHVISYTDRHRLPFIEAVTLEANRLVPVVPLGLPHYARYESELDLGPRDCDTDDSQNGSKNHQKVTIPADTIVFSNLWSTGHDPKVWSSPDLFIPDRFLTVASRQTAVSTDESHCNFSRQAESQISVAFKLSEATVNCERKSIQQLTAINGTCPVASLVDATYIEGYKQNGGKFEHSSVNMTSHCFDDVSVVKCGNSRNNHIIRNSLESDGRHDDCQVVVNRKLADLCCPFGVGGRRCVGEPLGRLQVFLLFVTIMRSCRIELLLPSGADRNSLMLETFGDVIRPRPFKIRIFRRRS